VGTSNGALACYLVRHGVLAPDTNGCINVFAEQGYSLGRPSRIDVAMSVAHGEVAAVRVGGMATRVISGFIRVPS
jgi:predicted PhzF superfamily epimerase YddE/YHI9